MKESDRGHLKIGSCCSNLHPNTYLSVTGEHQKVLVEALEFPVLILNAALKFEREREKHCSCQPKSYQIAHMYKSENGAGFLLKRTQSLLTS